MTLEIGGTSIQSELAMLHSFISCRLSSLGILAVLSIAAGRAEAAWLTVTNHSRQTVMVQEVVTLKGRVKRGKPVSFLRGESMREFVPHATTKLIEVFDSRAKLHCSGPMRCLEMNQVFSITSGIQQVKIAPVSPLSETPPR
jgi:hypothetical protein